MPRGDGGEVINPRAIPIREVGWHTVLGNGPVDVEEALGNRHAHQGRDGRLPERVGLVPCSNVNNKNW